MIADITITEKSFGMKELFSAIRFSIEDGEKVGVVGRNGIGKSTLFGILSGNDKDFTGEIIFKKGITIASTAQEHHGLGEASVMEYILSGLPEYSELKNIIDTYPEKMGDDLKMIERFTEALTRFDDKGFYLVEAKIEEELKKLQLEGFGSRKISSLSGGQKRMIEIVKIMHANAHLVFIDEPTNHMDYIAKKQFIDWMTSEESSKIAMLVITHDRDVLARVDRIVEIKDGKSISYKGNYDAYLKQNASRTAIGMHEYEQIEKRIVNLKQKVLDYQRLKEKSRNPGTIQKFKRLENESREELAELEAVEKPNFWIDESSVQSLDFKSSARYGKFKSKNIKLNINDAESRSSRILVRLENVALGYDDILFEGVNMDLREGEKIEFRGRNGAGKSTLIKAILSSISPVEYQSSVNMYDGQIWTDKNMRVGVYYQEIEERYLHLPLGEAIEKMYLDRDLRISETKVRQLASDYLFNLGDLETLLARLSGGQKARFQIISMLANEPDLLILDEPTNHLDLPSIEELEKSLAGYKGAVIFVSHDGYFRDKIGGQVIEIGD